MGVPSLSVNHKDTKDENKFWSRLLEAYLRKFTIIASSRATGEAENDQGVIGGHAYSVISAH
jgi:hypothetical protein